jgi:hypothetical protein
MARPVHNDSVVGPPRVLRLIADGIKHEPAAGSDGASGFDSTAAATPRRRRFASLGYTLTATGWALHLVGLALLWRWAGWRVALAVLMLMLGHELEQLGRVERR